MIDKWTKYILLENPEYFDFGNGLWTGKKHPFKTVTVIRNTNFTDSGKIDYSNVAILEVEAKQFEQRKLIAGDIIIERSGGGPKQPVGRVVYFDKVDGDYSFSNFTSRIRVINNQLNSKYVFYYLMYFYDAGNTFEMQAQTTGIRNLDFTKYKNSVKVPLLPLPEQRKIAYILSTVQKAIEQQDKLIRTTTELKKALMQKLFTEGTRGEKQKQTEIGLVPESWEVVAFDELFDIIKSQSHSRNKLTYKETNSKVMNIHYGDIHSTFKYEIVNIQNQILPYILDEFNKEDNNQYLIDGDILLADASEDLIDIGKSIEVAGIEDKKVIGGLHTIVLRPKSNKISLGYGAFVFRQNYVINEIRYMATGLSVYGISKGNLRNLLIPLPELEEQKFISNTIQNINSKIEFHQRKKSTLTDLFKTLLHELMTGERRVHEIEFETLTKAYKVEEQPLSLAAEPVENFKNKQNVEK